MIGVTLARLQLGKGTPIFVADGKGAKLAMTLFHSGIAGDFLRRLVANG